MSKRIFLLCLLFVSSSAFILASTPSGSDPENTETKGKYHLNQKRSFSGIDPFAALPQPADVPFYSELYYDEPSPVELELRAQIQATYDKVVSENRFVKFLDEKTKINFPVGIKSEIGVLSYVILIDSIIATPTETLLYASMQFDAPKLGSIHFRGADIRFSKEGGIVDGGRLELVGDYPITKKEAKSQLLLNGQGETYVEFDCNGFKSFGIDADLIFSRNVLLPEDEKGQIAPEGNVTIDIKTTVADWNDLLVAVDIPSFRMVGLDGFSFEVDRAVVDWSDTRNQPGVNFPSEYAQISPYFVAGTPNLWQGVFISSLSIKLPEQFETWEDEETGAVDSVAVGRTSFTGQNMILDDQGFSGLVSVTNLIPLEKGKMGNWLFSVDEVELKFLTNNVQTAYFRGKVDIPINKSRKTPESVPLENRLFFYSALIQSGGDFQFLVTNADTVTFDIWKADVTLLPSSYVEVKTVNRKFRPKACLNGIMDIKLGMNSEDGQAESDGSKNVSLASITFQNLEIQTVKPYVKVGAFSLGLPGNSMGGFPLSIHRIGGGQSEDDIFLDVGITLSLTGSGEDGGSFGAGGDFRIFGEPNENGKKLSYKFKRLQINGFSIDIDQGALKFSGNLNFYKKDPIYGNGISGTIDATFGKIGVVANAIFGSVDGYRYWYADALVDLGTTLPIFPGVFLNRFGGGAYYHMKMDNKKVGSKLGKTSSGIVYVPDRGVGLGLKAVVGIMGADENVFSGEVIYEMAFNSGGGVRYINFRGKAVLISPPTPVTKENLEQQAQSLAGEVQGNENINSSDAVASQVFGESNTSGAAVFGTVTINYNFDEDALHANFFLDINVAGGLMTGGGNAVMHFDKQDWYIYIGRPEPENRFSMEMLGLTRSDSYFVMGSIVPDTPLPPSNVSKILGDMDLGYMEDLNALADGAGIGFGSSFSYNTGDLNFRVFYGHFSMGSGFDVMLKNYGNASCSGRGDLGINGWYANGQAYAYIDGLIGIKVKLFRKTKKIDILEIGAAAIFQAKLPNPIWMKGVAGGYFKVLGGLVKGKCSFEIEIGEECQLINNSSVLAGEEIIAQLTPQDGASEVDVFVSPQAVFNYELEKTYRTVGFNDEQIIFKIALDELKLTGPNGEVEAEIVWNDDQNIAVLKLADILYPESDFTLSVSTSFQELKNGVWETSTSDGEELREVKSMTFKSGKAPDNIPRNNVAYSYPSHNMLNFYKDEYAEGYVKLNQGQPYLFEDPDYTHMVRFTSNSGEVEAPISYSNSNKEVTYSFPASLVKGTVYELQFVSIPTVTTNIEGNVTASETQLEEAGLDSITITTKSATGTVKNYEEQRLFQDHFRTSDYGTFSEKLIAINLSGNYLIAVKPRVHYMGANFFAGEAFSFEEMNGDESLIKIEADLTNNAWFQQEINPLIYTDYSFTFSRDVSALGQIPTKAISIIQYPYDYALTESAISSGFLAPFRENGRFDYNLAIVMNADFEDLQAEAAESGMSSSKISNLLTSIFPVIKKGDYWININYYLPGRKSRTSTYRHKIVNVF